MNYSLISKRFTYFILLFSFFGRGQNVSIKGMAHPWYAGKVIQLSVAGDYITNLPRLLTSDTIAEDGSFGLFTHADYTHPVELKVRNVTARLYVEAGGQYSVTLPEPSEKVEQFKDVDHSISLSVFSADNQELNVLIFDYERLYNSLFIPAESRFLSRLLMFRLADSLQKLCDARYKDVNNAFFRSYVRYSIASINASVSRGESFLVNEYILRRPLLYDHSEYMRFFNACFRGYLNAVASHFKGESMYQIINVKGDLPGLHALLKQDEFLKNDTLRELVILSNLWDFYFNPGFSADAVNSLVSQINSSTTIKKHREITASMLVFFNKLQEGSAAPDFVARTKQGTVGSLSNFKGRWVYINFFSTDNAESLKEMPKIASLIKTYGHKVVFLSICTDENVAAYQSFLRANPKFTWTIWHNNAPGVTQTAKDRYFVTGGEAYFLVNHEGYLSLSPAPSPSRGIEYRFNVIFKIKPKTQRTGIR
jgi:hypothetical protein